MNEYKKLIKGLRCSGDGISEDADYLGCANKRCKYRDVDGACDLISMTLDAANAITALQSENAKLRAALSRVEAERDAAIADVPHDCEHCKHAMGIGACKLLPDGDQFSPDYTDGFDRDGNCDHWDWRGAQGGGVRMAPTDRCDLCRYVRYSRDGGSTYCGRRKERCKFTPKEQDTKSASSAAQDTTTL